MKTIFVFNTGSSSVKISLLSPTDNTHHHNSSTPLRILTAHAQRIGTEQSLAHITFSSNLIKFMRESNYGEYESLLNNNNNNNSYGKDNQNDDDDENIASLKKMKFLNHHEHSLKLSSRSSSNVCDTSNTTSSNEHIDQNKTDVVEVKKAYMSHEVAIRTIIDEINKYDNCILSTVTCVVCIMNLKKSFQWICCSIVINKTFFVYVFDRDIELFMVVTSPMQLL